jgi:predicted secreted protein with PEFG-CTERM motif
MKTKAISSFFVLFAIAAGIVAMTPVAFADHSEVTIEPIAGSGSPGCEETPEGCFMPSTATVDVGGVVIFSNTDSAAHTFTSGEATDADSVGAIFDSSLAMAGTSFEWSPTEVGDVPYFCIVHPWMAGLIIVQEAEAEGGDADGLVVTITDSAVMGGTQVELEFSEIHVNYDITATQNGETVLQETGQHSMELTATHQIDAVGSDDNPISVEVVSLGIGAPGNEADWTGPTGTVATLQVVPEFGTIAMMILAVAIISIVAVTAKSRVIPRF